MDPIMRLKGLGVALVTPFNDQGAVDQSALEQLVDKLLVSGVNYLVALGTTAETAVLTTKEKERIKSIVVSVNSRRAPLVLGLGSNDTRKLCKEIKKVNANDFEAILSVTPYYNKPTQQGLFAHYRAVSAVTEIPLILYNVPSRTGVNLELNTTLELASTSTNIIGIKEACGDLNQIDKLIANAPKGFEVVSGDDITALESILRGASGVISVIGQALPEQTLAAVAAALSKDENQTKVYHELLLPIVNLLFDEGNPAGIKALLALNSNTGIKVRLPLVEATVNLRQRIKEEMDILKALTI
jgi:4-hydroxy-tetrahydrodipicolinate synthase